MHCMHPFLWGLVCVSPGTKDVTAVTIKDCLGIRNNSISCGYWLGRQKSVLIQKSKQFKLQLEVLQSRRRQRTSAPEREMPFELKCPKQTLNKDLHLVLVLLGIAHMPKGPSVKSAGICTVARNLNAVSSFPHANNQIRKRHASLQAYKSLSEVTSLTRATVSTARSPSCFWKQT